MKAYCRLIYSNVLQIIREPITIVIYIGFPIIFVLLFGMVFSNQEQSFSVGIVENFNKPAVIQAFNMEDNQEVFNVRHGTLEEQLDLLENKQLDFVLQGDLKEGVEEVEIYYRDEEKLSTIQLMLNNMYYSQLGIVLPSFNYRNISGAIEDNPINRILPGVLAITLMQVGLFGALNLSKLKENRTLRAYGVTPISKHTIIISELIVRLGICLIQGLIVIGLGSILFKLNVSYTNLHQIILWILLGGATFIAVGYMFVALFNSLEATNGAIQIMQLGMMFLSGVFVPLTIFPTFVQRIVYLNPVVYLADALTSTITNTNSEFGFLNNFVILSIILVISTGISTRIKWN